MHESKYYNEHNHSDYIFIRILVADPSKSQNDKHYQYY